MKAFITMVAVLAVSILLLTNAAPALAKSGWGLEDPQLCVNGQLLTVIPASPADVYVIAPNGAVVDYAVEHCGGASGNGVVPPANVTLRGGAFLRVTATSSDSTLVVFKFGDQRVIDVVKRGQASATFWAH